MAVCLIGFLTLWLRLTPLLTLAPAGALPDPLAVQMTGWLSGSLDSCSGCVTGIPDGVFS